MEKNDLEIDNLPNRLTFFRMLMIPVVVSALQLSANPTDWILPYQKYLGHVACWIFVVASLTDFLDGYIARKRNIVTVFGSFLDPIADKFLVVSSIIMLLAVDRISAIVVIVLVLREMYMTSLRLLALTEGVDVPVSNLGKWKTGTQMTAVPMLMIWENFLWMDMSIVGTVLLYISVLLSLWSALMYSLSMIKKLREKRAEKRKAKKEQRPI
ncbi:MAG TPA: CDP-diacylglycerol--glycerol-3-phosphate 3-phosphatidyltransferase [Bacteriovoracaceae bacterium]|nr:CDP-diacylglycerol--glycerol-3-phosphate 3-phosphatidyltransferase [Bacteriovoracaceae bacterium]